MIPGQETKIPGAAGQLSQYAQTTEPMCSKPVHYNQKACGPQGRSQVLQLRPDAAKYISIFFLFMSKVLFIIFLHPFPYLLTSVVKSILAFIVFFFWPCQGACSHVGSPHQGSNPCPLHWEHGALTTGLPGKFFHFNVGSWMFFFFFLDNV